MQVLGGTQVLGGVYLYPLIQCPQQVYNFDINRFVAFYRLSADLKIESGGTLESVKQGFI